MCFGRASFCLSELRRLSHSPDPDPIPAPVADGGKAGGARRLCAVLGPSGSGVISVSDSLFHQIQALTLTQTLTQSQTDRSKGPVSISEQHGSAALLLQPVLDLTLGDREGGEVCGEVRAAVRAWQVQLAAQPSSKDLLLVAVIVTSPLTVQNTDSLLAYLSQEVRATLTGVISVLSTALLSDRQTISDRSRTTFYSYLNIAISNA